MIFPTSQGGICIHPLEGTYLSLQLHPAAKTPEGSKFPFAVPRAANCGVFQKHRRSHGYSPQEFFLVGGFNPFEKYISQIGWFPQVGMKIKNIWNHHPVFCWWFLRNNWHPDWRWKCPHFFRICDRLHVCQITDGIGFYWCMWWPFLKL